MDIEKYISSGKLEAYVLGALPKSDSLEVERLAKDHPAIRLELEAIEQVLEKYALRNALAVPDKLKDKIIGRIQALDKENPTRRSKSSGLRGLMIPLWLLFVLVLIGIVWFWSTA